MMALKVIDKVPSKLCCLIGDPVAHSPSPQMYTAAFRAADINYVYLAFRVKPVSLPTIVKAFKAINVLGFNVTIPHKVAVMKYMDRLDELSQEVGAVNTVSNEYGLLTGYNTDVEGFIKPLKKRGIQLRDMKVLILGAGGASRACLVGLIHEGCRDIILLNRSMKRARVLFQEIVKKYDVNMSIHPLSEKSIARVWRDVDLVINSTPIGMYPNISETAIRPEFIKRTMTIFDLVYKPVKTKIIQEAEKKGAIAIAGVEMLVEQAVASAKLWTGIEPSREIMMQAALSSLGGAMQ